MGIQDDEWDHACGDPDLLREGNRLKGEIVRSIDDALVTAHARGAFDYRKPKKNLTPEDEMFLRTLGITLEGSSYEARKLDGQRLESIMDHVAFAHRLQRLYMAIVDLEKAGERLTTGEYRQVVAGAFFTSEMMHCEPGVLSIVEAEIDALEQEQSSSLIPSARCADLLRRADPTVYRLYTLAGAIAQPGE